MLDKDVKVAHVSNMEALLESIEPETRSKVMMRRAGERLGYSAEVIDELINPQDVRLFRLPCKILGKVIVMRGVLSMHNNARGPYKGGIRLAEDVTIWETIELSRLMSLKTAITDIEFGGGKTGIRVDMPALYKVFGKTPRDREFEKIISLDIAEYYAQNFRDLFSEHIYVPAPDMGTGPDEMAFIYNETLDPASVTGKPQGTPGWLPGRRDSTGFGCCYTALRCMEEILKIDPKGATVAIQGFGNVGQALAMFLSEAGVKVVAVTDLYGGAVDKNGLNIDDLKDYVKKTGSVGGFTKETINNEKLFTLDVDVLIPAATPHVINAKDAPNLRCKAVVEAANMPTTAEAMDVLTKRNIPVIPDILANAGGVIGSMEEYSRSLSAIKMKQEEVFDVIKDKVGTNMNESMKVAKEYNITIAEAAVQLAMERIYNVMVSRRLI